MFGSSVIDLVVLLAFTYFIGSIIISAVQEMIATALKQRPKTFEEALNNFIIDDDPSGKSGKNEAWKKLLREHIIQSTYFQVLVKKAGKYPAYMPASNFAMAVIEKLGGKDMGEILHNIETSTALPQSFKQTLVAMVVRAEGKISMFQKQLEDFYNSGMDRATGWYKQWTTKIVLGLSVVVAILFNIDTIKIANQGLRNPVEMKAAADRISAQVQMMEFQQAGDSLRLVLKDANGKVTMQKTVNMAGKDSINAPLVRELKNQLTDISKLRTELAGISGIQFGYTGWDAFWQEWIGAGSGKGFLHGLLIFMIKALGIALSVFALQLGAHYWFDLLNKVVNLRNTGLKPESVGRRQ
jgi:hypothetical protein